MSDPHLGIPPETAAALKVLAESPWTEVNSGDKTILQLAENTPQEVIDRNREALRALDINVASLQIATTHNIAFMNARNVGRGLIEDERKNAKTEEEKELARAEIKRNKWISIDSNRGAIPVLADDTLPEDVQKVVAALGTLGILFALTPDEQRGRGDNQIPGPLRIRSDSQNAFRLIQYGNAPAQPASAAPVGDVTRDFTAYRG